MKYFSRTAPATPDRGFDSPRVNIEVRPSVLGPFGTAYAEYLHARRPGLELRPSYLRTSDRPHSSQKANPPGIKTVC